MKGSQEFNVALNHGIFMALSGALALSLGPIFKFRAHMAPDALPGKPLNAE